MVPWTDFPYVLEHIAVSKRCHRRKLASHTTIVLSEHSWRRNKSTGETKHVKKYYWKHREHWNLRCWAMLNTYMDMTAFFLSNHNIFLHIYIVILENIWWTLTQKLVYLKVRELAARSVPWVSRIGGSSWHETTLNPAFWWKKSEVEKTLFRMDRVGSERLLRSRLCSTRTSLV